MIPRVGIRKQDGNTGVVRPGSEGIAAIVASCSGGQTNVPTAYNDETLALNDYNYGPLTDYAGYFMPETQRQALLVKPVCTTVGAYGAITKVGGGTATPAATAGTFPYDDFNVAIQFPNGGALGTVGITYQTSLNGGLTWSAVQQLGTALIIVIPNTGISITLGTATQTILAAELVTFTTSRPLPTNADLPATLEVLRTTAQPFESVIIDCVADDSTVALIATWLLSMNARGKFPVVFLTCRPKNPGETEASYLAALTPIFAASTCVDIVLCADVGDMTSASRGLVQARATGVIVGSRSMAVDIGVEPAFVEIGPLTGIRISDVRGNPNHHDEDRYPGLDDLRLTVLRTIEGFPGVYINNTNLLSPAGSDYVYLPHARTMNRAASIIWQTLTKQLSRGVTKNPTAGPNGERYIAEHAAQLVEKLGQDAIDPAIKGKVDDIKFRLSRVDNIASNQGAVITCFLESVSLAYVKQFTVTVRYVKQIATTAGQ